MEVILIILALMYISSKRDKKKKDTQDGLLWESPIGKRRVMMVVSSLDGKRKLFHDSNHKKYHHPICVSHHSFTLMKAINNIKSYGKQV